MELTDAVLAAEAFFWFLLFMLLTLLYFTFYGSLAVFVTGNLRHANILGSTFYTTCNLFAGFAIAPPSIPGWWCVLHSLDTYCYLGKIK